MYYGYFKKRASLSKINFIELKENLKSKCKKHNKGSLKDIKHYNSIKLKGTLKSKLVNQIETLHFPPEMLDEDKLLLPSRYVLCWFFCHHLIVGLKWTFKEYQIIL